MSPISGSRQAPLGPQIKRSGSLLSVVALLLAGCGATHHEPRASFTPTTCTSSRVHALQGAPDHAAGVPVVVLDIVVPAGMRGLVDADGTSWWIPVTNNPHGLPSFPYDRFDFDAPDSRDYEGDSTRYQDPQVTVKFALEDNGIRREIKRCYPGPWRGDVRHLRVASFRVASDATTPSVAVSVGGNPILETECRK